MKAAYKNMYADFKDDFDFQTWIFCCMAGYCTPANENRAIRSTK